METVIVHGYHGNRLIGTSRTGRRSQLNPRSQFASTSARSPYNRWVTPRRHPDAAAARGPRRDGRRCRPQPACRGPGAHRHRGPRRVADRLSGFLREAFWRPAPYLERPKRGRGRAPGRLCDGVAQGRPLQPGPGEPDHLAGRDRAQPGDRPAAVGRDEPPHGADRGGRRRSATSRPARSTWW